MKKLFAFLAVFGLLTFGMSQIIVAQDDATTDEMTMSEDSAGVDSTAAMETIENASATDQAPATEEPSGIHKVIKKQFIEGGAGFMGIVVLCLILGLALVIERIIYLNLSSTNTKKLLENIETTLNEQGVEAALEVCRNTRGPIASIFYQGLSRLDEGVDVVEKTVVSYGSVQMGLLEKGLTWISLFIAIAPMLGFMGTVIGMIQAFDAIAAAGEISPTLVASGIKVALITTVTGLIVAIILQLFYNYLISKIDSIVNDMEDSSITLLDIIVKYNAKK
ncbi:MotA/TolQ/ExbB proton channel family protein [Saccharicrinis sp. FJH54]|uniref:MotA/TolQ/ExbB proton channel family protein n=1 Tax=Saccharicrinis sp. FJH54 TaxID=3344665 RepID=UPI0035D43300